MLPSANRSAASWRQSQRCQLVPIAVLPAGINHSTASWHNAPRGVRPQGGPATGPIGPLPPPPPTHLRMTYVAVIRAGLPLTNCSMAPQLTLNSMCTGPCQLGRLTRAHSLVWTPGPPAALLAPCPGVLPCPRPAGGSHTQVR